MTATLDPRSIGVLICTYRRGASLARGLAALAVQQRPPDEVIIVVRDGDDETLACLGARGADGLALRIVTVSRPGTVAALNAGLEACGSDVLAITDDDTVPRPDWLARILDRFRADPGLGALGGRDRCHDGETFDDRQAAVVGRISWWGRATGNHHIGAGAIRDVDFLKGANMSFRTAAFAGIRFDRRLRGSGAQPYEDGCFSLAVRRAGWRMRYDPEIVVEHYPGRRADTRYYGGVTRVVDAQQYRDFAYNNVLCYWDEFSVPRHVAFILWSLLIGVGLIPGLLQAIRFTPALGLGSWQRFLLAMEGKSSAYRDLIAARRRAASQAREAAVPEGRTGPEYDRG